MITISPGHWLPGTGASDLIDEVTEARKVVKRVVEILRANKITTNHVVDDSSKNQSQNLKYLVNEHNSTSRELDVSIHFNSSSRTDRGVGVEVLYLTIKDVAAKISKAISDVSGLINRGAKLRKDLAFLNGTNKPAILIEVCFVSSTADTAIYKRKFEEICYAIAECLVEFVGKSLNANAKESDEIMAFSSPSLKAETELTLNSKARLTMIVEAAIKAGAHESWRQKHENREMTEDDYKGLALKAIIDPQLKK
ncbi:N-acetylmuramoyl-L-alanine amidase [Lysinibacillus telephonicus]|uniref:N-acetylmuramoyl-L-alanine amidase n=1 Tax=Lysinibacillus telephonicus TaxID=1714840 RepID=UPI00397BC061